MGARLHDWPPGRHGSIVRGDTDLDRSEQPENEADRRQRHAERPQALDYNGNILDSSTDSISGKDLDRHILISKDISGEIRLTRELQDQRNLEQELRGQQFYARSLIDSNIDAL